MGVGDRSRQPGAAYQMGRQLDGPREVRMGDGLRGAPVNRTPMLLVIHQIDTWSGYERRSQAREWLTREGTLTRGMSGSIRRECDAMRGAAETEHRARMSNPIG